MKKKDCKICGKPFESKTNGVYCSDQCKKDSWIVGYHARLKEKNCSNCGQFFAGKRQETRCQHCKDEPVIKEWRKEERKIVCRDCGSIMGYEIKSVTHTNESRIDICEACRIENRKPISENMIRNNPMFNPETVQKATQTKRHMFETDEEYRERMISNGKRLAEFRREEGITISEEARQRARERMQTDNPMKNPETVAKMQASAEMNDYQYPKGSDHWLWKGNRDRAQTIRTRLYPTWTFRNLERADFKCEECGISKVRLEVHHESKTFRECLNEVLAGRRLDLLDDTEFEMVSQSVIEAHNHITGKVVCVACHRKIDEKRH